MQGEGVAYRGRVLFQLQTILGELPFDKNNAIDEIRNVEVVRVGPLLQKEKYKLHAYFLDATLINMVNKRIEFEISIGRWNY